MPAANAMLINASPGEERAAAGGETFLKKFAGAHQGREREFTTN